MTPDELLDGYLAGDLDAAGQAELDALLRERPELARELSQQQLMENALRVLQGDGTADEQVRLSVLSVIRGKSDDAFKTDLLKMVQAEDAKKKRAEAEVRHPTPSGGTPRPLPEPLLRRPARRAWAPWATGAAGLAAAALLAAGAVWWVATPSSPAPAADGAFLLAASGGVRVLRGDETLPARADMALKPGDRVAVPDGAEARLGFADDTTRLDLRGPADLRLHRGGRGKKVELLRGALAADVPRQDEAFVVASPHAEIRADQGRLLVEAAPAFARLEVREGTAVLLRPDGKSLRVPAEHYALAGRDVELAARRLVPGEPATGAPEAVAVVRKVQGDAWVYTGSPAARQPAKAGQGILEGQSIHAERGAVIEFPDQTRLDLGADTVVLRLLDPKDKARKDVLLERGTILADVTKQPADKPMWVRAAAAEVKVVGTRFLLAAEGASARVQVEEGVVRFRSVAEKKEVDVRSGFQATAAPGVPFEAAPVPGGARYLEIDLTAGTPEGDGDWYAEGRVLRQRRVSRDPVSGTSTQLFRADAEEGVVLEALAEVAQVTPGEESWGFGLAAVYQDRHVVLRSHQGTPGGSLFEFKDVTAIPFEHGREGSYRLKLRVERRADGRSTLRGKIWQGDREPDGWMIEDELELRGGLTHVGFQTVRCACAFSAFKVKVLKD